MTQSVTDISANRQEKIANAAKVIGRSDNCLEVFSIIYRGKQKIKTINDILSCSTILKTRKSVLREGKKLASEDIVKQQGRKLNGDTAYEKLDFYTKNKAKIISLVKDKKKLEKFPTKDNPQLRVQTINVRLPKKFVNIKQISIDDIDSFSKVKKVKSGEIAPHYEKDVKDLIKSILGELGKFTDWGGEPNDLYSSRMKFGKKRVSVAFALKGRGTSGILTTKKMGKNGDQLQRLFKSPASIFLVQYNSQIGESVIDQMKSLAEAKSAIEMTTVYFGVIDGNDTSRLIKAYSKTKE
jgi:hypothetical protein